MKQSANATVCYLSLTLVIAGISAQLVILYKQLHSVKINFCYNSTLYNLKKTVGKLIQRSKEAVSEYYSNRA